MIVRVNEMSGARHRLYLDRVKYLDRGDSLSIDRIVIATPGELRATVEELNIERGDTLRVSTDFDSFVRAGGYEAFIPRWSAHEGRCWNGAWVSLHTLTKVEAAW